MTEDYVKRTSFPIDKYDVPIGALTVDTSHSNSGDVDGNASSTQSSSFSNKEIVMLTPTDGAARVEFGTNPTADSTSWYLPQDMPRVVVVESGDKIAVKNANVNIEVLR